MGLSRLIKRAAQVNPKGIATEFGERTRTWAELEDRISRLAGGLRGLGIQSGDWIGGHRRAVANQEVLVAED